MELLLYFLLSVLMARYVDTTCSTEYDVTSCSYTETCESYMDYYETWRTFLKEDGYDINYNEKCIDLQTSGYRIYTVYLIIRDQDDFQDDRYYINNEMPRAYNQEDFDMLNAIYGLILSGNNYNKMPIIRTMDNLALLDLSNNYITSAILSNRNTLPKLTEINLSHNLINNIVVFDNPLITLTKINLAHNSLIHLPDAIFYQFTNLENIDLSYNLIDKLTVTTFENLKHVVNLNLSNNRITNIYSSLFRFSKLKVLNLSGNLINDIKMTDFEQLLELETLDLSSNLITSINVDVFSTVVSLHNLYLNGNKLEALNKDAFTNLNLLTKIDLSKNNLSTLPKGAFRYNRISFLCIEDNKLEGVLEKGIFEGINNTKLDLSNQFLTEIKEYAFLNLFFLETLLLNGNNIQSLSKMGFKTLKNLQRLDLSSNKITNIDFIIEDLSTLNSLLLKNNFLTTINHDQLQYLNNLEYLDLSGNQIAKFEATSFHSLNNLINLDIQNNSLLGTLETDTFDGLVLLPSLDISRNKLTVIQNASFNHMNHLKELNLSHCDIRELQYNTFISTGYIETLDLSYNKLEDFLINTTELSAVVALLLNNNLIKVITSQSLFGLPQLNKIVLSHNNIVNIHNQSFDTLLNLNYLDLSDNKNLHFSTSFIRENIHLKTLILSNVRIQANFSHDVENNTISDLRLSKSQVKDIHELHLNKLNKLYFLTLNYNNISKLQIGDFTNLTALCILDLSFNQISSIQPGVFKDNSELQSLNIYHNYLSTIGYGVFRGLIHLQVLDMSYNNIKDLQTERFYEAESLSRLIVDHNKINKINAEDFVGTSLTELSVGGNSLPCQTLAKLSKHMMVNFKITAIRTDEHGIENFKGITCNNGRNLEPIRHEQDKSNNDLLNGLQNILYELMTRNIEKENINIANSDKISNILEKSDIAYNEKLANLVNLTATVIAINNNTNTLFNTNNIMLNKIIHLLNKTVDTRFPATISQKDPITSAHIPSPDKQVNQTTDLVLYINKIKKDLETAIATEKQKIEIIESKVAMNNYTAETISKSTSSEKIASNHESTKSIFTDTCVALILLILIGFIVYKLYMYKMYGRNRFSSSSRELPTAMEHSGL